MNVLFSTLLIFSLLLSSAQAGILLDSTRVIFPAAKQDVTLGITNKSTSPRLIQAWVDSGDPQSHPSSATAPFIVTPPIFRVNADKSQTLRILFTGGNVPQDRESVYWLNVLEVQPKPATKAAGSQDYIQFSVRSRLKIFYRPTGLPGSPEAAVSGLRWRAVDGGLECENPSAFNVSINNIWFKESGDNTQEKHHGICPAKGKRIFIIKQSLMKKNQNLFFSTVNDYGQIIKNSAIYQH